MALAEEDIVKIQQMISVAVDAVPQQSQPVLSNVRYELDIRERIVRVEEELKNQRELIHQVLHQMDKRFEQVDKRIDESRIETNKRLELVDKRLDESRVEMNKRFEESRIEMDKRFEESRIEMDKRFEGARIEMDKRFEQVDKRFEQVDKQFAMVVNRLDRFMFWSLMLTCSAVFAVVKLV